MTLHVGVHESVGTVFPPAEMEAHLDDVAETSVVTDDADLAGCDALVTFAYDDAFLDADLDWIHSIQSGVDRFPKDALREQDIRLTSSAGIHGDSVGETVAGYMLQFARLLHVHRANEPERYWAYPDSEDAFTVVDETCCVVGMGALGRGIASRAKGLGMDVVGVRRTPVPVEFVSEVFTPDAIEEAVADARFVAVAVPLTDDTEGLVDASVLDAMREDAYLLDVSRGGVVDQDALLEELEAGTLAGAALDVFETEPLPEDSPFWEREDVVVTPHAAAAHDEYAERVAQIVVENVRRLQAGESLANAVV
jgi:D-2-hydroxyacid dehydrogenase (NADP+)